MEPVPARRGDRAAQDAPQGRAGTDLFSIFKFIHCLDIIICTCKLHNRVENIHYCFKYSHVFRLFVVFKQRAASLPQFFNTKQSNRCLKYKSNPQLSLVLPNLVLIRT